MSLNSDHITHWKEQGYSSVFVLTDEHTYRECYAVLKPFIPDFDESHLFVISAGEEHKTIETATALWNKLLAAKADRRSLLINLGGGMVCDLGGFVAATYQRGMHFLHIPTTLLAMVDASVGGKTAINFQGYKNQVGVFANPVAVLCHTPFLQTLDQRQLLSGFAEMIKVALVADADYFDKLTAIAPNQIVHHQALIDHAIKLKQQIVEQDKRDYNLRHLLNFGHTIGHALEAWSAGKESALLHGEAVAVGMVVESWLSWKSGLLSAEEYGRIEQYLRQYYPIDAFFTGKLPHAIYALLQTDKKREGDNLNFTLLKRIGEGVVNQNPAVEPLF